MKELNAILTIAARDFTKLLRDRGRLIISFIFPLIFIGALGGGLQANIGKQVGFNFLTFTFTGVLAQVLF
ncbi:MAG: ABC-2 type transporter, partial [Candidatus Daviesbacteria bacterium GW2011_GWB1_36_5]